jgi:tetratricopeptide (TPR) repeat protein
LDKRPDKQRQPVEVRAVIEGHLNLARLYRDMGKTEKAEQQFLALIEKLPLVHTTELAQARREFAEFYRDQSKYGEAVAAYKNLILQQEETAFDDLGSFRSEAPAELIEANFAKDGQEIANSYNELADAYRGWADTAADKAKADEMSARADAAFGLSVALDRFAVRMRRYLASSDPSAPTDRDDLADNLGDAFLKFDKGPRAVLFYQYALDVRKGGNSAADRLQVGKSYDKLGNFYRSKKDYVKAEQNYTDQAAFYQSNPQSAEYAKAVRDLAALYGDDPKAAPELAVAKYREALALYRSLNDWSGEDVVLYRLTKLYEKRQQPDARLQALRERVTALKPYYDQLVSGAFKNPGDDGQKLISEYLNAINVLGYVLAQTNDMAGAEAAYQRAWDMRKYVSTNVRFVKDTNARTLYDAMLGEYQYLLSRQQKPELATAVREFRDNFNRAEERNKVGQASAK